MASSLPPVTRTYVANGAINPLSFVKLDTTTAGKNPKIIQCGAGDSPLGITKNEAAAALNDQVEVCHLGGGARLKINGTVTMGQHIKSDASGYGVVVAAAGDRAGARAAESGVAGDFIGVHVVAFEKFNADAT